MTRKEIPEDPDFRMRARIIYGCVLSPFLCGAIGGFTAMISFDVVAVFAFVFGAVIGLIFVTLPFVLLVSGYIFSFTTFAVFGTALLMSTAAAMTIDQESYPLFSLLFAFFGVLIGASITLGFAPKYISGPSES